MLGLFLAVTLAWRFHIPNIVQGLILNQSHPSPRNSDPAQEGALLLNMIADGLPSTIDGREAVRAMKDGGSPNWRQMEWIGFYPEFWFHSEVAPRIGAKWGPRFGNMTFDIQREHVWDLKSHSSDGSNWAPLNDVQSVEECIATHGGVGFLILSGPCSYDDDGGSFKVWHQTLKGGMSWYSIKIAARGARSRRRKTSFQPDHFIAFRFSSIDDIERAREENWLKGFQKGMRNSNDRSRREKIMVDVDRISDWALVEEIRR